MHLCFSPDLADVLLDFDAYGTWASSAVHRLGLSDVGQVEDKLASLTTMENLLVWKDFGQHLSDDIYAAMCTTRSSVEMWKALRMRGLMASMQIKQEAGYMQLGCMDATSVANRRRWQQQEEREYTKSASAIESLEAAAVWYDTKMAIELMAHDEKQVIAQDQDQVDEQVILSSAKLEEFSRMCEAG